MLFVSIGLSDSNFSISSHLKAINQGPIRFASPPKKTESTFFRNKIKTEITDSLKSIKVEIAPLSASAAILFYDRLDGSIGFR